MRNEKVLLSEDWTRSAFAEKESELLLKQSEFTKPFFQFFVHLTIILFAIFSLYDILALGQTNVSTLLIHYLPGILGYLALEIAVHKGDVSKLSELHLLVSLMVILPLIHLTAITSGTVSSRYFFIAIILTTIYYIVPGKKITSGIVMAASLVLVMSLIQLVIFDQSDEREILNLLFYVLVNLAGLMITYIIQSILLRLSSIRDSLEDKCYKLDRMQEEFINTLSSLSLGILLLDKDQKLIVYNKSFLDLSGLEEISTGKGFFEQLDTMQSSISSYYWQKVKLGKELGEEVNGEYNSEDLWVYLKGIKLNGEYLENLYLLILEDITDQKQSKFAQDDNERHLRTIFNQRSNIILYERMGRNLYFTDNILNLTGYTKEELCARQPSYESLVLKEDHTIIKSKYRRWINEGRSGILYLWYRIKCRNQEIIWIEERMSLMKREDERDITTGILIDNTDLKLTERELKRSDNSLRKAQKVAQLGNWEFDFNNDNLEMSDELYLILGIDHGSEASWQNFIDYIHPEDQKEIKRRIEEALNEKADSLQLEFRIVSANNVEKVVQSITEFVWKGNNLVNALGTLMDITKQKELERQLFQNQKMEAVGTLAGGIAHDFNNILNIIMGYAAVITEMLPNDGDLWYKFDRIMAAAKRARNLVKHILTISRQHTPIRESINMKMLLEDNLELLRAAIPSIVEIKSDLRTESSIFGDPNQIEQVVMNICTNAYYAMKQKGGKLYIRLFDVKDNVCLEIEDTGGGIPQKVIDKIFDPYFTTKPKGEGTGLGLAIVKGIIEELDGDIQVKSEMGHGTKFRILIPRYKGKEVIHIEEEDDDFEHESSEIQASVLFIDDETDLLELFKSYLELNNMKVDCYDSSHMALEAFKASPGKWDVIISDIALPEMDGIALIEKIREIKKDIPVIMYSGFKQSNIEETLIEIGVDKMLIKPVFPETMVKEIRQLLFNQEGTENE